MMACAFYEEMKNGRVNLLALGEHDPAPGEFTIQRWDAKAPSPIVRWCTRCGVVYVPEAE